jgi:O-antigen ligase
MRNLTSSHAHNGYLEAILSLGIIGLVIIILLYLAICRKAIKTMSVDFDWGVLFVTYMIMAVVHNIAEAGFESLTEPLTAIILLFSVSSWQILKNDTTS